MNFVQEQRQPRNEQPPDRIDQQTSENDGPDFSVPQQIAPLRRRGDGATGRRGDGAVFSLSLLLPVASSPRRPVADQSQLLIGHPTMSVGRLVTEQPERQPQEAQRASENEGRLPSVAQLQQGDYRGGDDGSDGRAAVEDGHCEGALASGKPFGDDLRRARPVPRLTQSEHETKHT